MTFPDPSPVANHLWQSTLCAAAAWLLTLTLQKNRAAVRYSIWLAASAKFLIPFSLLVAAGSQLGWRTAPALAQPQFSFVLDEIGRPFSASAPAPMLAQAAPTHILLPSVLISVWLCGFLAVAFSRLRWWRLIRAAVRQATPLDIDAPILVLSSRTHLEPGVFGFRKPVLLLPQGIETRLTHPQLNAIVTHELCHVRRHCNLTATFHMAVESLFWLHPLVWWIEGRLIEERERACDEEVLQASNDPEVYAQGILNVCRYYLESPVVCVAGITGSDLKQRIQRIVAHPVARNLDRGRKALLTAAGILAVAAPVAVGFLNAPRSQAQSRTPDTAQREFDAVSVKPYLPKGPISEACDSHSDPIRLGRVGCTLKQLVEEAYGLKSYQVRVKGPAWIEADRYAIQARTPTPAAEPEMLRMLQPVLAARFHLNVHWEAHRAPAYLLQVASHGPKLQPASKTNQCGVVNLRETALKADCLTIDDFAEALELVLKDRPVLNRTALSKESQFKFDLAFSLGDDPAAGASLFSALPDELGLTLKAGEAPLQTLVIDHAQRPQPN